LTFHRQVDRLFALYQAIHPDRYIEPAIAGTGNYWIKEGSTVDANTPLLPFWNSPTTFWTSNEIKDTRVFGYVYPETQIWNYYTQEEYGTAINATIARLYGSSTMARLTATPDDSTVTAKHGLLVDEGAFVDWVIRAQGKQAEMPSTFVVQFFLLGDFSSDPVTEIGSWTVLSAQHEHDPEGSEKRKRMSSIQPDLTGMVSLTDTLLDEIIAGKMYSLHAGDVVVHLDRRLSWKVVAVRGLSRLFIPALFCFPS
jgi:tyrosinase